MKTLLKEGILKQFFRSRVFKFNKLKTYVQYFLNTRNFYSEDGKL